MDKKGLYNPAYEHDACGVAFVANLHGEKSKKIVDYALTALKNLDHRGACGCEDNTGDGAGILIQVPHKFLNKILQNENLSLPEEGKYGTGLVFLPNEISEEQECESAFKEVVEENSAQILGWRDVPIDLSSVGETAKGAAPKIRQVFIGNFENVDTAMDIERRLYVIRKCIEHKILNSDIKNREDFYIPSLSCKTMIYKGMLLTEQVESVFLDLQDPDIESGIALVHSRFSTNTFPSWKLAHPYRYLSHNGEINTVRGNTNWMHARQTLCDSEYLPDLKKVLPVITEGGSDSAVFDNVLEFLYMGGYELPHAVLMMIPEPWAGHELMSKERKAFYEYHACLMEPWDGPASIAFTDGTSIGAVLDRNGLRPSRYYVTKDDLVIMASEAGVLDIPPEDVLIKNRLQPGRIFLVDTSQGRIIDDEELKKGYTEKFPYNEWLKNLVHINDIKEIAAEKEKENSSLQNRQRVFGYTKEDLEFFLAPMVELKNDPIGSMGNDASLALLSNNSRLLYDYFKQLFAQVTNPPLDGIREELVTQVSVTVGPQQNIFRPSSDSCSQIKLDTPILTNKNLAKLKSIDSPEFQSTTLSILFDPTQGEKGLRESLDKLFKKADKAIEEGKTLIILSDKNVSENLAPIPALLATSGLHHHLIRKGTRTRTDIIVETGEARQVHHMCVLLGYGAKAINPYLAMETIEDLIKKEIIEVNDFETASENYIKALNKGILKVTAKMGISTIQSYTGAQIFEAVGLNQEFVDEFFTWTATQIQGVDLNIIAEETLVRHHKTFTNQPSANPELESGGLLQWRRDGEYHMFNPQSIFKLQHATSSGNYEVFKEYSQLVDEQSSNLSTLRGLFNLKWADTPVPLEEVEPVESIFKRFSTGAMSYGSISSEAHETLAIAMNRIGGKSNTGEGGEDPSRFTPDPNGDLRRSAMKQVASGRFGVTSEYLVNADDLQIKMAQGAKPGEGGQLPGHKVYPWIAKVRYSTPGVGLISPPPHHDIYSIEDLAQLIYDLKNSNRDARINVKLVSEVGVGTVAAGVSKGHSDVVLISGHDGGTGASPITSIKHAGTPWELGLAETQQVLVMNRLRDRIVVQVDGQMKTGRDVVIGALLGADEFGFATAPLVVMGCVMMRVCHLNTCPVGIATQDPNLRKCFEGKPEHVVNFFQFIAQEVRELMSKLGFRSMDEMTGRVDKIEHQSANDHWKARGIDFSALLYQDEKLKDLPIKNTSTQDHKLEETLDMKEILPRCLESIETGNSVKFELPIRNVNRTTGTITGSELTKKWGGKGLPEDTIHIHFNGSAGQSFGAFLPKGMTFELEGDANDYMAKGLSGGKIMVYPSINSTFVAEENILIGNVALYGATSGEAYFRGLAGERFCVRNSGAEAVVEGVGDHCCEYMTGGRVVVLGQTGRNFAAGMSGGIAFILDLEGNFELKCNKEMVELEKLTVPDDIQEVKKLINNHITYTKSTVGKNIIENWEDFLPKFIKVMPIDYKRAMMAKEIAKEKGIPWEEAVMEGAHG